MYRQRSCSRRGPNTCKEEQKSRAKVRYSFEQPTTKFAKLVRCIGRPIENVGSLPPPRPRSALLPRLCFGRFPFCCFSLFYLLLLHAACPLFYLLPSILHAAPLFCPPVILAILFVVSHLLNSLNVIRNVKH